MYAARAYLPKPVNAAHVARTAELAARHPRRAGAPPWIMPEPPRFAVQLGLGFDQAAGAEGA